LESLESHGVWPRVAGVAVAGLLRSLFGEFAVGDPVGSQQVIQFAIGCLENWLVRVGHGMVSAEVHGLPVVVVASLRHECGFFGGFDAHQIVHYELIFFDLGLGSIGLQIRYGWVEPVTSGDVLSNFTHRKLTSDPSVVN
jgi:hypothetical protein